MFQGLRLGESENQALQEVDMSATAEFWRGFGWFWTWLGLFGGISILVWAVRTT